MHVLNDQHPKEEDSQENVPDEEGTEEGGSRRQHPKVEDSAEEVEDILGRIGSLGQRLSSGRLGSPTFHMQNKERFFLLHIWYI